MAFCTLFDSAMHPLSHFNFTTALGDKNYYLHCIDEKTERQRAVPKVKWLVSARDLVWTYSPTSLEKRL